jgi:predicted nuclease of predicted toxin-antitoxin system
VKFLIDRCAGRRLADWLRAQGHDVVESRERGPDPGDRILLEWAAAEARILVTLDTDFGELLFVEGAPHCGVIRLPDVPSHKRIELMVRLLERFAPELEAANIITVRGGRIRISKPPPQVC